MQVQRNEITTGLLFLLTAGLLTAVVLSLTHPGLFHKLKEYTIYFDSASGIRPGSTVSLAGRKIGQVTQIYSPVPLADRPAGHSHYEAKVVLQVAEDAVIYKDAKPSMQQLGLLGEQVIDFSGGTQTSGDAESGASFVGYRVPSLGDALPKMLALVEPVAAKATTTLEELERTANNLNDLLEEGSDFRGAIQQIKELAANLRELTSAAGPLSAALENFKTIMGPEGSVQKALSNIEKLTNDLIKNDDIAKTLENVRAASKELNTTLNEVNGLVGGIKQPLDQTLYNTEQMTDTLKRQPWRLVWPSTKKYPEEHPPEGKAEIIVRKKRTEASPK